MMQYALIFVGVFFLAFVVIIIRNKKINGEINQNGIETDAVVSRIKEHVTTDLHGTSVTYTYYVTYRAMNGQTV